MSLGIESGATTTNSLLISDDGVVVQRGRFGPANYALLTEAEILNFFQEIKSSIPENISLRNVGIGMPGVGDASGKEIVSNIIRRTWHGLERVWVGSDAETALACIGKDSDLKLIVIAGTGSNCHAKDSDTVSKIGGFGHVAGDRGSSYAIAQRALRLALKEFEHRVPLGESSEHSKQLRELVNIPDDCLIKHIMKFKGVTTLAQLAQWSVTCTKTELAKLTIVVLEKWREGNALAAKAILEAVRDLAEDCACLIKKFLASTKTYSKITIGLTGSLFTKNEDFSKRFKEQISSMLNLRGNMKLQFRKLLETAQGALTMVTDFQPIEGDVDDMDPIKNTSGDDMRDKILPTYVKLSVTESRNPNSMQLDTLSIPDAIDLMVKEESKIHAEISNHKSGIAELVVRISECFQRRGRLFYVGAGTSGRLGVLDASECPPTFKSPAEWVQGIIAGGPPALTNAVEGAEDSVADGFRAIEERKIGEHDIVVGIAASGRTPFVWGSMYKAHCSGAFTAFLTFNPELEFKWKPDLILALNVGPEVLTGSTRLKCGSATKCVLNILSTLAMVKYGKCYENLMVDLSPANQKLRDRSLRIVMILMADGNVTEERAKQVLLANNYNIRRTVQELKGS